MEREKLSKENLLILLISKNNCKNNSNSFGIKRIKKNLLKIMH